MTADNGSTGPMNPSSLRSLWRRAGAGATWLLAGRVIVAGCGLLQLPLAFGQLRTHAFGLWVALTGLLWSLTVVDGGLGFAVQNRVTQLLARGQPGQAAELARWASLRLLGAALIGLILGLAVADLAPWPTWLDSGAKVPESELRTAVAIVLTAAAISVPLGLSGRLVTAAQESHVLGISNLVAALLGLAAFLAARANGSGLLGFTAAACVLPIASGMGSWWHVRRSAWWRRPAATAPPRHGLAKESALFFAPVVGSTVIGVFVPTLAALTCGPAEAATLGILQRLFGFGLQLHSQVMTPIWPAFATAAAHGDGQEANRLFRVSRWITIVGFALPMIALTPCVPAITRIWLGAEAPQIPVVLGWAMAGWTLLQLFGQMFATVLNGIGRIGWSAVLGAILVTTTLLVGPLLGPKWGSMGIIAALAVPYALVNLTICAWQTRLTLATLKTAP